MKLVLTKGDSGVGVVNLTRILAPHRRTDSFRQLERGPRRGDDGGGVLVEGQETLINPAVLRHWCSVQEVVVVVLIRTYTCIASP